VRPLILPTPALLLVALIALGGCDRQQADTAQPANTATVAAAPAGEEAAKVDRSQKGTPMPADTFTTPDGKTVTLGDFKGQPLLVNLWATWCAPCVREMPSLDRLAAKSGGKLKVMVVSQDSVKGGRDPVPDWWAKAKLANLEPYRDVEANLGFAFGGGSLPTTILFDADGKEVWRVNGGMEWDGPKAAALLGEIGTDSA